MLILRGGVMTRAFKAVITDEVELSSWTILLDKARPHIISPDPIPQQNLQSTAQRKNIELQNSLHTYLLRLTEGRQHTSLGWWKTIYLPGLREDNIPARTEGRQYTCADWGKTIYLPGLREDNIPVRTDGRQYTCPDWWKTIYLPGLMEDSIPARTDGRQYTCPDWAKTIPARTEGRQYTWPDWGKPNTSQYTSPGWGKTKPVLVETILDWENKSNL
jgi:hypothetical protein